MPISILLLQESMNSHFKSFYNFLLWIYLFRNERQLKGKLLCKCKQNAAHHHNFFFLVAKEKWKGTKPHGNKPAHHILSLSYFIKLIFLISRGPNNLHRLYQKHHNISVRFVTVWLACLSELLSWVEAKLSFILLYTEILENKSSFLFIFYVLLYVLLIIGYNLSGIFDLSYKVTQQITPPLPP